MDTETRHLVAHTRAALGTEHKHVSGKVLSTMCLQYVEATSALLESLRCPQSSLILTPEV